MNKNIPYTPYMNKGKSYMWNLINKITSIDGKINRLSFMANQCFEGDFRINYEEELKEGEYKGCCDEDEKRIITKCYNIFIENDPSYDKDDVLIAIFVYYYETQVLEYYINRDIDQNTNDCFKFYMSPDIIKIRDKITTGDEVWLSSIRKLILNMNPEEFKGGKRRLKYKSRSKRHTKRKKRFTKRKRYNRYKK